MFFFSLKYDTPVIQIEQESTNLAIFTYNSSYVRNKTLLGGMLKDHYRYSVISFPITPRCKAFTTAIIIPRGPTATIQSSCCCNPGGLLKQGTKSAARICKSMCTLSASTKHGSNREGCIGKGIQYTVQPAKSNMWIITGDPDQEQS